MKYFAAQIENWYFLPQTECKSWISWSGSIPIWDNPIIWQFSLCFMLGLQWILTSWFIFGGENTSFIFGQKNISPKNSITGKVTKSEAIWFPSSVFCPDNQVKLSSCKLKKEPSWWKLIYFTLQSIAGVWKRLMACDYVHHDPW